MRRSDPPVLVLNQMAGPLARELAVEIAARRPTVLLTGHPDTLAWTAASPTPGLEVVPAPPYRRGSHARRLLSWLRYTLAAAARIMRRPRRTPLVVFSNPPLLPPMAWLLHRLRGHPYVVVVHDVYPDVLIRFGPLAETGLIARGWRWLNRKAYESAAAVVTLGEEMAARLDAGYDAGRTGRGRTGVVHPWVDTGRIRPRPKSSNEFARRHGQADRLTVLYSGNIGITHDVGTMLEAARRLANRPRLHFLFIGEGGKAPEVRAAVEEKGLPNVTLLPWQEEEVLPLSLATGDVALVSLEKGMEGLAIPSKSVYAMAAGSALLCIASGANELRLWCDRFGCGEVVEPGDVEGLVAGLERLLDDPALLARRRAAARAAAEEAFSRGTEAPRLADLVLSAVEAP